jgi:hypothetical protein
VARADDSIERGGELIFPEGLLTEERLAARHMVERFGDQAQFLLDELSARIKANAVRTNPLSYLRGLVARAHAGTFVPEAGLRVAAARRRLEAEAAQRHLRQTEEQRQAAERDTPEFRAKRAARHSEIRQWLDTVKGKARHGETS